MLKRIVFIFLSICSVTSGYAAQERLTFAYSAIAPDMAGVWMAKELGAFEKQGLSVDLVYISSGALAIQALIGGSAHAALGASNAVVSAILKGAPIIAVGSDTNRPTMILWVQPEITGAEQLQGKTLAITRYGSTTDFMTRLILKKLGLEGKVDVRPFGGVVEGAAGFRSRLADGVVSSQRPGPQAKKLVESADLEIPFSNDFLVVSNEFYRKSPANVENLIKAYIEGIAGLRTRKQQALEMLAKYLRQRGGSFETDYEYVLKYLAPIPRVEPAAVKLILEMVGQSGPTAVKIYDNSIIEKLVQEGFIDNLYKEKGK